MFQLFNDEQIKKNEISTLKRWLRPKLDDYTVAIKDLALNNEFYRGVSWDRLPERIEQLSYPPPANTSLSRASRAGQAMFYASRGAAPVFFEVLASAGQHIALSEWTLKEPIWMHNLGFHPSALRRLGGSGFHPRAGLSDHIVNESKKNVKLRRLLSEAFTAEVSPGREYRYKLSVAINELLFDRAEPLPLKAGGPRSHYVAGTVYPAMRMKGVADNVAIWPSFADSALHIRRVRYIRVEAADSANLSFQLLTVATASHFANGSISWQMNTPDSSYRSFISYKNGIWISRDGNGRIYDCH